MSPTLDDSTPRSETPASITEILNWIDPTSLPKTIRTALQEIGPFLASGLTYREIASCLDPPRSEDYVAAKVTAIRRALISEALKRADEMRDALRERIAAAA